MCCACKIRHFFLLFSFLRRCRRERAPAPQPSRRLETVTLLRRAIISHLLNQIPSFLCPVHVFTNYSRYICHSTRPKVMYIGLERDYNNYHLIYKRIEVELTDNPLTKLHLKMCIFEAKVFKFKMY